ncbi:rRNA pseudouridine synthase [candidate division KSB1 bacterium]|nr:rRNA pseudouridine synthase [candidate division KSB1 bacterium]RQW09459.1 MAG: rRNA pseudouridine synthase [candidate division KSB1 bacterium]
MMRINRYLASCGLASRRAAEDYISQGRVTVNGRRAQMGVTVDEFDVVRVDGKQVRPIAKKVYVLFHKPKGIITTAKDEMGRKSVLDMVKLEERIFPVGRLDRNSEGALLLTNDGEMANRLLHPSRQLYKTYRVRLDRPLQQEDLHRLVAGMELEDGPTAPCRAHHYTDDPTKIELRLHEGRNHIVRRMFAALGYEVKALKRTQFGPLSLKNLARGQWRLLSPIEIVQLRRAAGASEADGSKIQDD